MGSCSKWVKTQPVESRSPASRSAATTSLSLLSKKIQLGGTTCSCWWDPETKQPAVCKEVITRNLKKRCFFCWVLKGKNQHVHFFFVIRSYHHPIHPHFACGTWRSAAPSFSSPKPKRSLREEDTSTWRIIPFSKWSMPMISKSPK